MRCLTCANNNVLIGTVTLDTLQEGGTKCVDTTISPIVDSDLKPIETSYVTLPTDCIAYDGTK